MRKGMLGTLAACLAATVPLAGQTPPSLPHATGETTIPAVSGLMNSVTDFS